MRILVVEGSPCVAEILADAFSPPHEVVGVGTASAAMDRLKSGLVDAMVTDGNMPGVAWEEPEPFGPDLLAAAAERGVPAVLFSGDAEMVELALRSGFRAYRKGQLSYSEIGRLFDPEIAGGEKGGKGE